MNIPNTSQLLMSASAQVQAQQTRAESKAAEIKSDPITQLLNLLTGDSGEEKKPTLGETIQRAAYAEFGSIRPLGEPVKVHKAESQSTFISYEA